MNRERAETISKSRSKLIESLQELDALKASILDAIPQAVVGLQNRQINFANTAVEEVFGWHPEELIGKSVTVFYRNDEEAEEIGRHFYTTLEHQRTFVSEFPCRRKDGRDILCRMRSSRIGERLSKEKRIVITYEDITEQRRAEEELANSREQLRNLSIYLQSVREKESTRIAREIHDELGQSLTALQMDLAWLGARLPAGDLPLAGKVQRMAALVDATVDSVHRISTELRPILLDDLGLIAAMEWQVQEFEGRTGVQCKARLNCKDGSVEKDLATTLFRVFQETLTNIARHAEATMAVSEGGRALPRRFRQWKRDHSGTSRRPQVFRDRGHPRTGQSVGRQCQHYRETAEGDRDQGADTHPQRRMLT
jgi:PAS domain S-box-containing protein